jgi:hypothetical protein
MRNTTRRRDGDAAKRSKANAPDDDSLRALLDHLARLLAKEYLARLRRDEEVGPASGGNR